MRVLYIDVNCKSGSTGKIVYDLYQQGREHGIVTAIAYGRGGVVEEAEIFKFGLDWETRLHALLTRFTGLTGCWSFFSTRRLLRFMDAFRPDVVHIHELHAYFVNLKPLFHYLEKHRIPVVQTLHCEFSYTGKCGYAYECEKWKTECGYCPRVREYPKSILFDCTRRMYREKQAQWKRLDKVIISAPSRWLASRARQSFLKEREIDVVPNGIDTDTVFYPRKTDALRKKLGLIDEKVVLAVAPALMSDRKGGRWVIRLAEAMKDENIRFILIGVDDLSEKFPVNVIALGKIGNQQELTEYYSLADCFVICSERENFPTTCLEAFCCGTPVVGFSSGGTSETAPYPYGRFCEYGNINQLLSDIRAMLETKRDRISISEVARSQLSRKVMFQRYQEIYDRLV